MAYSFESTIRYSEVDLEGKLTWIKLLDYFQDSSVFQSESLDLGVRYLAENHIAWVLNTWQISVNRMPSLCEHVKITTLPYDIKGFFGMRNFVMETMDGERLAYANSFWTLIDTQTNRPSKVRPEMDRYILDTPLEMEVCGRKLLLPPLSDMSKESVIPVTRQLIDTNGHVNNGRYVELALGYVENPSMFSEVRAEYRMQARQGDEFIPMIGEEQDKISVAFMNQDNKPYAIVQFMK